MFRNPVDRMPEDERLALGDQYMAETIGFFTYDFTRVLNLKLRAYLNKEAKNVNIAYSNENKVLYVNIEFKIWSKMMKKQQMVYNKVTSALSFLPITIKYMEDEEWQTMTNSTNC